MTRRRRRPSPPPHSPLISQGFAGHQSNRAALQVVREIHADHIDLLSSDVEGLVADAIARARQERSEKEGA